MAKNTPIALIDIGSSSLRLVIYQDSQRGAAITFNEKIVCDLAEGLDRETALQKTAMARAHAVLRRFARVLEYRRIGKNEIFAFATSAVRDADNGAAFARKAAKILSIKVNVLSERDEARLSALGVIQQHEDVDGIVGDLGGGSLEIAHVVHSRLKNGLSLPIGTVRFANTPLATVRSSLHETLTQQFSGQRNFYAVGGSWRNLGMLHILHHQYPLQVIDGYMLTRQEIIDFAHFIAQHPDLASLPAAQGINRKRLAAMPLVVMILAEIMQHFDCARVVFSAAGLREGCFYDRLDSAEQARHPMLSTCRGLLNVDYREQDAEALYIFIKPIARRVPVPAQHLIKALSLLGNIAQNDHPEYRVEHAFLRVLHLPAAMFSHTDRVWLAFAVAARYGKIGDDVEAARLVRPLISADAYHAAIALGRALRVGFSLSGGAYRVLSDCALGFHHGAPHLELAEHKVLRSERVEKRLAHLESALAAFPDISPKK